MEANLGKRVDGDPPIAVVLLDRLVDDDRGNIGNACFSEERIERAEVGRDEIMRAVRLYRHEGRGAGLRGGQIFCNEGYQRIGALGRGWLVARKRWECPQDRRGQRQMHKATARSAWAKSDGRHGSRPVRFSGDDPESTPSLFQIFRRRATIST